MTKQGAPKGRLQLSRSAARALDVIRRSGTTSRADIADALDLSAGAVSILAGDLIERGLVLETGVENSGKMTRGRPRVALQVNPEAAYFVGAKLNERMLTVSIMDFSGALLGSASERLPSATVSPAALAEHLDKAIDVALAATGLDRAAIAAVGLGIPGFVELDTGLVRWSPFLQPGLTHLKRDLEAHIDLPVHIDNDAHIATLAELWFGEGRKEKNFLTVTIEHGLGLGVVINGELFRGGRGLGAELAHVKIQYEGALCRCGQRGCLEAYIADYAIAREAPAALAAQAPDEDVQVALDRLAAAAGDGDQVAAAIFQRAGRMLGLGLANLANLFDPGMIVLTGAQIKHYALMEADLDATMRANSLQTGRDFLKPRVHLWGDDLWARGAGALAIDQYSRWD